MWGPGLAALHKANGLPDNQILCSTRIAGARFGSVRDRRRLSNVGRQMFLRPVIGHWPARLLHRRVSGALHFGTRMASWLTDGPVPAGDELAEKRVAPSHLFATDTWYGAGAMGCSVGGRSGAAGARRMTAVRQCGGQRHRDGRTARCGWQPRRRAVAADHQRVAAVDAPLATPRILSLKHLDNSLWVGRARASADLTAHLRRIR
jgi:hypothetical protein